MKSIKLCSRIFVDHFCTFLLIVILPSESYHWWVVCILWYSLCIAFLFFFERLIEIPSLLPCGNCLWWHCLMFCHQLLLFSLVGLFNVCCSVHQHFHSFSGHSMFYKLSPKLMQWLWSIYPLFKTFLPKAALWSTTWFIFSNREHEWGNGRGRENNRRKCLCLNAKIIKKSFLELEAVIINGGYDIVGITETWLGEKNGN